MTNSFPTLILGLTKLVYSCWESTPSSLDTRSPSWKTETKSSLKPDCYKSAAFYPWMYLQVCVRSLKLNNVRHKCRVSGRMANSASWEILRFKLKIPMEKTMETSSSYRMKLEWNIQVCIYRILATYNILVLSGYPSFNLSTLLTSVPSGSACSSRPLCLNFIPPMCMTEAVILYTFSFSSLVKPRMSKACCRSRNE